MAIRNPILWGWDQFRLQGASGILSAQRSHSSAREAPPAIRRIGFTDIKQALAQGFKDFSAHRTDAIFLCVLYPAIGLLLGRAIFGYGVLPLLFPLASGFALVGPFAAVGLEEMSRRREQGVDRGVSDVLGVARSPSFPAIIGMGLILVALLALWMVSAGAIYQATLGPGAPASVGGFVHDVFATPAGWALIAAGVSVGFVFAAIALAVSIVSFPLLLDRDVGLDPALRASIKATLANPGAVGAWGAIVAAALVVGSIPCFLGLAIVLPVLGHATWHLYRRLVAV